MSAGKATIETRQGATVTPEIVIETTAKASPDLVFEALADPTTHLEWGGRRIKGERLTALDGPAGPATVGTAWTSVGATSFGEFHDRSVVTEIQRPNLFEFTTESEHRFRKGRVTRATHVHRYELEPVDGGTRITHRQLTPGGTTNLPWWIRAVYTVPPIRAIVLPMMVNEMAKPGLKALAGLAEERSR